MDTSIIFGRTDKGLVELKTGCAQLAKLQAVALCLVDGESSMAKLTAMMDQEAARQLPMVLVELQRMGMIEVSAAQSGNGEADQVPSIEVVELSPTESVQAWAEAQRGARELQEHGYYSPATPLRHASHAAGAGINRVLIVEDDETTAKVLEFLLKEHDFQVITANDSESAFAELEKAPLPDVVLLDVMLPGLDGFGILRHMRQTPSLQDLPAIMVTAQISDEHVMQGLREGADGYVFKPFRWETLYACIKGVL